MFHIHFCVALFTELIKKVNNSFSVFIYSSTIPKFRLPKENLSYSSLNCLFQFKPKKVFLKNIDSDRFIFHSFLS